MYSKEQKEKKICWHIKEIFSIFAKNFWHIIVTKKILISIVTYAAVSRFAHC